MTVPALSPLDIATVILAGLAVAGLVAAGLYALTHHGTTGRLGGRVVVARAASYAGLALAGIVVARTGVPGMAVLIIVLGTLALLEWSRLFELPVHHAVSLLVANVVIVVAVATAGSSAATVLIGGLVLVGVAWPVLRVDTGRAIRDLGFAAVGCIVVSVLLVHGVALTVERGESGTVLFLALAVACATSDVGAYVVGSRYGRAPLSPRLSPSKTREGLIGNIVGAALGIALFGLALVPAFGAPFTVLLIAIVAVGSVWGDLLESAVKREAGVKDAGHWLPGFGGILDRIDSLLVTVALAYWAARWLLGPS